MSALIDVVYSIEEKLNSLLERYSFLKEENEFLHKKIATLEYKLTEEAQLIKEVEKNITC